MDGHVEQTQDPSSLSWPSSVSGCVEHTVIVSPAIWARQKPAVKTALLLSKLRRSLAIHPERIEQRTHNNTHAFPIWCWTRASEREKRGRAVAASANNTHSCRRNNERERESHPRHICRRQHLSLVRLALGPCARSHTRPTIQNIVSQKLLQVCGEKILTRPHSTCCREGLSRIYPAETEAITRTHNLINHHHQTSQHYYYHVLI